MLSLPLGAVNSAAGTNSTAPAPNVIAADGRIKSRSTPTFVLWTTGSYQCVSTGGGAASSASASSSAADPGTGAIGPARHAISDTAATVRSTGYGRRMRGQLTRKFARRAG